MNGTEYKKPLRLFFAVKLMKRFQTSNHLKSSPEHLFCRRTSHTFSKFWLHSKTVFQKWELLFVFYAGYF